MSQKSGLLFGGVISPLTLASVAAVNAAAAIIALTARPDTTNWNDPGKISCHSVWNVTGYASVAMVVVWLVLIVFSSGKAWKSNSLKFGCAVSWAHALSWLLLPSWS